MPPTIAGLALKTQHKLPLQQVDALRILPTGIEGNVPQGARRRVTLLSLEQWREVQQVLDMPLLWTMRRANILVQGVDLPGTIGRQIQINDVVLQVNGETEPCEVMDLYCPGLRAALTPDCRGGVYASVIKPGRLGVGDLIEALA